MTEVRRIADLGLVMPDLMKLHRAHWEEAERADRGEFRPQYDRLRQLWQANMVRAWGAFDGDRMVGHVTVYLAPSMHTGETIATEDALFVLPAYRKGCGTALLRKMIADLRAEGVAEIWATCRPQTKVGVILRRLKFWHVADTYLIRLQGA